MDIDEVGVRSDIYARAVEQGKRMYYGRPAKLRRHTPLKGLIASSYRVMMRDAIESGEIAD
jgi:hypothetical protein